MATQLVRHNYVVLSIAFVIFCACAAWSGLITYILSGMCRPDWIASALAFVPSLILFGAGVFTVKEGWRAPAPYCGCGCR